MTVSVPPPAALDHLVAGIVDVVDVVAAAAGHRVGAETAIQRVVAAAAVERVVAGAADQVSWPARCR